ncbi:glycosyltransferase [Nocardiopsis coralliicola]
METRTEPDRAPERGRIVMLVDNGVRGDSRVQKEAVSMADAGWDVVLVGRSPSRRRQEWRLGRARVVLLPVPTPLNRPRRRLRRFSPRHPLAYHSERIAGRRTQEMRAWRADLYVRRAAGELDGPLGMPLRAASRGMQSWVKFRSRQQRARDARFRAPLEGADRVRIALWPLLMGDRAWRRLHPHLWDWELAYGTAIDALEPDLLHANDHQMLGVAARAKLRAAARGRRVRLVWDAHEYVAGLAPREDRPTWHPAVCAHEAEYARFADAVVTVSPGLAELLSEDFALPAPPTVVLNAPSAAPMPEMEPPPAEPEAGQGELLEGAPQEAAAEELQDSGPGADTATAPAPDAGGAGGPQAGPPEEQSGQDAQDDAAAEPGLLDIRARAGLAPDVPLIAYSGGVAPGRGVDTAVEALPMLPGVHLALASVPPGKESTRHVDAVLELAAELGVADRVHVFPYVPHWEVVRFLSTADAAVSGLSHVPNHEIALSNKFFEYVHARLPLIASDVRLMAQVVRRLGIGAVYTADDAGSLARAAAEVLGDPARYREAMDASPEVATWWWSEQAARLDAVYAGLLDSEAGRPPAPAPARGRHAADRSAAGRAGSGGRPGGMQDSTGVPRQEERPAQVAGHSARADATGPIRQQRADRGAGGHDTVAAPRAAEAGE